MLSHRTRHALNAAKAQAVAILLTHVRIHGVAALPEALRGPARALQDAHETAARERAERDG